MPSIIDLLCELDYPPILYLKPKFSQDPSIELDHLEIATDWIGLDIGCIHMTLENFTMI